MRREDREVILDRSDEVSEGAVGLEGVGMRFAVVEDRQR